MTTKRELVAGVAILGIAALVQLLAAEQRNGTSFLRGPYNADFFWRHNKAFRVGVALHFAHGKQHDVLQLTPLSEHSEVDARTEREFIDFAMKPPRTEPTQEYYGPYVARMAWRTYLAIDWTHDLHEQTYDVMASQQVPWERKKEYTDRSVRYYLEQQVAGIPRSPAPLDVTMRRAAVMMKPYFTFFRNKYPKSNNFFYGAHWWHPVAYEAIMIAGNDREQETSMRQLVDVYYREVIKNPPLRMLLTRELMPRYARMSPEAGNIFDNLHMLHGIVYDILAYEGWTERQKKDELYRVIQAMSYQPGDELIARKFSEPHADMDPRVYAEWMRTVDGGMNRIMTEMMQEMMPMMMSDITPDQREQVMRQFRMKLTPAMQDGEVEGSLHDALMKVYPQMKMMPGSMEPGQVAPGMVSLMLNGWRQKHGMMPDIAPLPMDKDPVLPSVATALPGGVE